MGKNGLEMFFEPWQAVALKVVMDSPSGVTSSTVWKLTHQKTQISRASVISFLQRLEVEGLLERCEIGKGEYPYVYKLSLSET